MPEPGTVLAFDFGLKRIGVAVGEAEPGTAHPLRGIAAQSAAGRFSAIARLLKEWRPARLVVGRPLGEDGAPHEMTRRAERFANQLAGRFGLPVALVDERYSSAAAESLLRGRRAARHAIDSVAAQLILEQYFDEHGAP
jgi:putative Holliday junction resolvase